MRWYWLGGAHHLEDSSFPVKDVDVGVRDDESECVACDANTDARMAALRPGHKEFWTMCLVVARTRGKFEESNFNVLYIILWCAAVD